MEDASDVVFGPAIAISEEEYREYREKPDYRKRLKSLIRNLGTDLGLVSPEVRVEAGRLISGEFQIQLNDAHLPVVRGLSRSQLLIKEQSDSSKPGVKRIQLFDPFAGFWRLCAENSSETKTKVEVLDTDPFGYSLSSLELAIRRDAGCLVASPVVHLLLENLKNSAPNHVERVRAKLGKSPPFHRRLTAILRRLLEESISIVDLAGILESLVSLRAVKKNGAGRAVYQYSELEDSPLLVANERSLADLSAGDLTFAARLGVMALSLRRLEEGLQILPFTPELEKSLSASGYDGPLPLEEGRQILQLLGGLPGLDIAFVVSQSLRACIKERLRFEFPTVPVFGSSEIPRPNLAFGYYTLCKTLHNDKRFEEALLMALEAASLQPQNLAYRSWVKRVYEDLGRPSDAKLEYQIAAEISNDPSWQADLAEGFFDDEFYEDAIILYSKLVKSYPHKAQYFNRLGSCFYKVGAFRRAITNWGSAAGLQAEIADYYGWAQALRKQGDYVTVTAEKKELYKDAVEKYRVAISKDGQRALYHYGCALALLRLSELDRQTVKHRVVEAVKEFRKATRLDRRHVNARLYIARCLSEEERLAGAVRVLERLAKEYPSLLEIQMNLAKAYAQNGKFAEAVDCAERINRMENPPKEAADLLIVLQDAQKTAEKISSDLKNHELIASLGHIHTRLGNFHAAAEQYRRASVLAPAESTKSDYHKWLGNTLFKLGEWEGAYEAWKEVSPPDALTLNNMGTACDNIGMACENIKKIHDAKRYYQKASKLAPDNFVPLYNLGRSNQRLDSLNEARDAYQRAVECNKNFAGARFYLGNCYYRLKEFRKALLEWEEAIRIKPEFVEALFNLGVCLWRSAGPSEEKRREAANLWRKALLSDRNLIEADNYLEEYELGRGPKDPGILDYARVI